MSEELEFECPECNVTIAMLPTEETGECFACPKCGATLRILSHRVRQYSIELVSERQSTDYSRSQLTAAEEDSWRDWLTYCQGLDDATANDILATDHFCTRGDYAKATQLFEEWKNWRGAQNLHAE